MLRMSEAAAAWRGGPSTNSSSTTRQQHSRAWPYAPTQQPQQPQHLPPAGTSPQQQLAKAAAPTSSGGGGVGGGVGRFVSDLIEHIRGAKGARHLWEVAVKRNGMTTSLALLGGVLVADTLLYRPKGSRQAMMQASLAAHSTPANSNSSNGGAEEGQQQQHLASSAGSSRHLGTQAAAAPAHA